jgi:hypothetical protein
MFSPFVLTVDVRKEAKGMPGRFCVTAAAIIQVRFPGTARQCKNLFLLGTNSAKKRLRQSSIFSVVLAMIGAYMKWYYEWRLKRVRMQIAALEQTTKARLHEDYTGHSRLRVLTRMAESLERRLSRMPVSVPVSVPISAPKQVQEQFAADPQ